MDEKYYKIKDKTIKILTFWDKEEALIINLL